MNAKKLNTDNIVYEYVFEHKYKLYARLYNKETKEQSLVSFENNEYVPEIYIRTEKPTIYKDVYTLGFLEKKEFENTYDLFKFIKNNGDIPNFPIYGNRSRPQKFIRDNFPNSLDVFDIKTQFIDIETRISEEKGFASPSNPHQAVCLIQIYDTTLKKFIIMGTKELENKEVLKSSFGEVFYKKYNNEREMLEGYIKFTKMTNPAIITGFNSNQFDIPYLVNRMDMLGMTKEVNQLSPLGEIKRGLEKETKDAIKYIGVDIVGVMCMDLRDVYIKYQTSKPPRYSLDVICKTEIGEGKVEYDGSLEYLYNTDYAKYVEYGIKDVELLLKLEEKLKLIKVSQQIAYMCGVNPCDVSGTFKQWGSLMYNTNLKNNVILPLKQLQNIVCRNVKFPGGWVRVREGLHQNISSFDFGSLYPNIISEFNIGIDTYISEYNIPIEKLLILEENRCNYLGLEFDKEEYRNKLKKGEISRDMPEELKSIIEKYLNFYQKPDYDKGDNDNIEETKYFINILKNRSEISEICKKYNVRITPNGCIYLCNFTSSFASLMIKLFAERKEFKKLAKQADTKYKKDYYDLWVLTSKILMNSAYGSLSMDCNNFSFGELMAESVTTSGRYTNQMVAYLSNIYLNKEYCLGFDEKELINFPLIKVADTDSGYYSIPDKVLFKFQEKMKSKQENG